MKIKVSAANQISQKFLEKLGLSQEVLDGIRNGKIPFYAVIKIAD